MSMPPLLVALAVLAVAATTQPAAADAASPKGFTADDLVRLARVSDPQVSPDGRRVAYTLRETDLEADRGRTDLWVLELAARPRDGVSSPPRRLTQHPASDSAPRWAPDGLGLYFLSSRGGSSQVWYLALAGGEPQQVTTLPLDVGSFEVSPRGDRLAVSMEVFPDCADLKCTVDRQAALGQPQASGHIYDQLFVRHWDNWKDGRLSQLFTLPIAADGKADKPVNVSRAVRADVPSKPFGGDEDYAFSRDGARIVFSARLSDRSEPWSTNFDLYEVAADGSDAPRNLTADNPAWDAQPVFLANGDLAWLAMARPGFEADRFKVMLRSARDGKVRPLTGDWDRSVGHLGASFDGKRLLATADDIGQVALFEIDPATGARSRLVGEGQVQAFAPAAQGVVIAWASLGSPPDLHLAARGQPPARLTSGNAALLSARVYAGAGYGVVFIDFHGSPGYGQAFTDSISQDWGGKPLVDLQKGLDAALARYDWLDGTRACSLGASYGGFMQNWIAGNWPDRFKCIVNHAGIFDQRTMYYTTEELWFTEWENGGPYYANPQVHEKFNPADHVTKWKTPMLVIHGALDYRVPYSQGLATFTALQRQGVESRLVFFPDENHWILKPANSLLWHAEVIGWLDKHTGETR